MNTSTQQKSYERYTGLFNKVCSSPLFLVLAALVSVYCVFAIVGFFNALGSIISIPFAALDLLFALLTTIGVWMLFLGAKKKNISAGNFGLARSVIKYNQVIKTILLVCIIIVMIAVIALVFMLQASVGDDTEALIEEIKGHELLANIPEDARASVDEVLTGMESILALGGIGLCIIAVIIAAVLILELIRFSKMASFLSGAKKTYKTGQMSAPPSMFFCVLSYIFAAIGIIGNLGVLEMTTLSIPGLAYSLLIGLGGFIVMQNRKELASIYTAWQVEIGMVSPAAAAAQAPVAEAPVAEAPVAEEAPAAETTDAE